MDDMDIRSVIINDFKNYKKWKARLKTIQSEFDYIKISGSNFSDDKVQGGGGISDPTYQAVENNESLNREFAYVAYCLNRVNACMDAMTEQQRLLMTSRYFEGLHTKEVMKILGVEKSEYYKRLQDIIELCAEVCGYMTEKG